MMYCSLQLYILSWILTIFFSLATATAPGTPCIGQTAAVSRSSGQIDIFFSGTDGRLYTASKGPNDNSFSTPKVVGTIQVAYCSSVSAISSAADEIDVFVTGADTFVYTASLTKDGSYTAWVQLAGGSASVGTLITPVSASSGSVQVFWVGTDGSIYEADLHPGNATAKDMLDGSIGAGNHVTVVPRYQNPNTVDLLFAYSNQHIYHDDYEAADRTSTGRVDLGYPSTKAVAVGAPITAVMLHNGDLHLFVVALDYQIYTSVRTQSPATGFSAWALTGDLLVPISATIYGVATAANTIELFVTGSDSLIYMSTWDGGFSPWTPLSGVYTLAGAPISGIPTGDKSFTLFVTGLNKNVSTIDWTVGQSVACPWWTIGDAPIACTANAADGGSGSGASSVSSSGNSSGEGKFIGIGFGIGLLIGVAVMGGVGYWLHRRRGTMQLRQQTSKETMLAAGGPAELSCPPLELQGGRKDWKEASQDHVAEVHGNQTEM